MPSCTRFVLAILTCIASTSLAAAQETTLVGDPTEEAAADPATIEDVGNGEDRVGDAIAAETTIHQTDYAEDPIGDADTLLRSGYDATGVRVGSFVAFPALDTSVVHTSNVHQSAIDRDSDTGLVVAPELRVQSDWSRHSVGITASSSHVRYNRYRRENVDEATVSGTARIDVTSRTTVDVDASFRLGQEDRDSIELAQGAVSGTDVTTWEAGAGLTQRFNRLTVLLRGDVDMVEYGDTELAGGGTVDNGDRDYVETKGTLRLGYEVSPVLQPFVEGAYSIRDHDRRLDRDGLRRDSEGLAASAGVAINLGPILRGEVSAGYQRRNYDDPALKPAEGMTLDASLTWAPTRLTIITAGVDTTVDETTVLGASAAVSHGVDVEVSHSLSYNLTAKAGGSYTRTDYPGTSIAEDRVRATAALDYQANPNVVLRAGYAYQLYESTEPQSDFDTHTIKLGVRLQR